MAVVTRNRPEKKIPIEQLQQEHLAGPADEPMEKVSEEMKENQIVVTETSPRFERITFRNQRDPGYPLEFHFSSKENPFKMYKLIDGEQYTLPVEVIKNLEGCREDVHKYRRNKDGIPEIYIAGYKTHFVCERV